MPKKPYPESFSADLDSLLGIDPTPEEAPREELTETQKLYDRIDRARMRIKSAINRIQRGHEEPALDDLREAEAILLGQE